jgi:hypothetical protein
MNLVPIAPVYLDFYQSRKFLPGRCFQLCVVMEQSNNNKAPVGLINSIGISPSEQVWKADKDSEIPAAAVSLVLSSLSLRLFSLPQPT